MEKNISGVAFNNTTNYEKTLSGEFSKNRTDWDNNDNYLGPIIETDSEDLNEDNVDVN
jgi:hypothetical protein